MRVGNYKETQERTWINLIEKSPWLDQEGNENQGVGEPVRGAVAPIQEEVMVPHLPIFLSGNMQGAGERSSSC